MSMDFYAIRERATKKGSRELYPEFLVKRSKDLMVAGHDFYAIWNADTGMWSQDDYDVQRIIDEDLAERRKELGDTEDSLRVLYTRDFSNQSWNTFKAYVTRLGDNYHPLDDRLTFSNTEVSKTDYVSKRLPYPLEDGNHDAWDEIIGTLYMPEERKKIEWAIGAIVSGDSRKIQKFLVFYGDPGTGKGTILDIIRKMFEPYCASFEAGELTSNGNSFPMEQFRNNPLVAIQTDGDLSHIASNTKLNTLVSHEPMVMKIKFKSSYDFIPHCFLMLASNEPVQITNAKSGLLRRLIDVSPSGQRIGTKRYYQLMKQVEFELGAIAKHCLDVYEEMGGKDAYNGYIPTDMMARTNAFYNFVDTNYMLFSKDDMVTLKEAYENYKIYCENSNLKRKPMYQFKDELKNYFSQFDSLAFVDGKQYRSLYRGFKKEKFELAKSDGGKKEKEKEAPGDIPKWLVLNYTASILDAVLASQPAQYAGPEDKPQLKWADVVSKVKDLHTDKVHFVKMPQHHIVIDFDLKDENGDKSLEKNLIAAAGWKPTYAEVSKGGAGLHLHYIWDGDTSELSSLYAPGIEIKKFMGNSSLRRRVSRCNDIPIAHLSSGLPLKEAKKTVNFDAVKSERGLRDLIERNLNKEIHPGTKPSIDFIEKILDDAYKSGLHYDVSDMRPDIMDFAIHSSHQSEYCLTRVALMKFKSEDISDPVAEDDGLLVFFDIEVFPNLVLVNWKYAGADTCQRMINPRPCDIEELVKHRLVGFNCRRYDNHILYAVMIGKTIPEVYDISQGIINGSKNCMFGEAYNISYTDVYDFSSKKQSLKKWEIELGIHHQELGLPWDQPVPEEKWLQVAEYCDNDVFATEAVFNHLGADWTARQILAEIAGMSVNDTTNSLTTRIIFGREKNPQSAFNYRFMGTVDGEAETFVFPSGDILDKEYTIFDSQHRPVFPGYKFDHGVSTYRGEEVGEGGYVYAEPGIHTDVALLDIASMHPSSIVAEQLFGPYTKHFQDILQARIYIKHKEYDKAKELFGGRLAKFLDDPAQAKALAGALKIAINSVYGLTSAKFDNPFRDIRNIDNIVAKRGALFMINLKHEVQKRGYTVAHIKTDSIKIPDATPEIIQFVMDYGKLYGYTFEHEATYDRMCLVNDAVYIARYSEDERNEHPGEWTATGAQFQVPYVFKTLFSHEPIRFADMCETKSCTTALYLDMNENLPDVSEAENEADRIRAKLRKMRKENPEPSADPYAMDNLLAKRLEQLKPDIDAGHCYVFIGKVGLFAPVKKGHGGGLLMREKDGKYYAVGGTSGYRWMEAETVCDHLEDVVDISYFEELNDQAIETISQYGSFEDFVDTSPCSNGGLPWKHDPMCGEQTYENCIDCPHWKINLNAETIDESFGCEKLCKKEI